MIALPALVAGLAIMAPVSAQASTPAPAAVPSTATMGDLPHCLTTKTWDGPWYANVKVTNNCSKQYRFQIIWDGATDSQCITLKPGKSVQDEAMEPAWFAGLETC
ncbi:MAG: hypothetical protein ACRDTE_26270 [Pseudonocardiaceae bacterium]